MTMLKVMLGVFFGMMLFAVACLATCAYWGNAMERAERIAIEQHAASQSE